MYTPFHMIRGENFSFLYFMKEKREFLMCRSVPPSTYIWVVKHSGSSFITNSGSQVPTGVDTSTET